MAKKTNQLTEADLQWFDISLYPVDRLRAIPLAGWIQIVNDRLALQFFINANRRAEALRRRK